jgi:hypothetical protein
MQPSDFTPSVSIRQLLTQAAETACCRSALRDLGEVLPTDDAILITALHEAASIRDANAFSHLYLSALLAGRRIPATVLEFGAALLPEAMLLLHTALRLDGDVAESLATAVRSGRMGNEREATAIIAGWLYYERCQVPAPADFLALTRKVCRTIMRTGMPFVRSLLCLAAKLSADPVVATILNADIENDRSLDHILTEARKCAEGNTWERSIPAYPESQAAIAGTLKRAAPKAGRNDPCPCGSGRKFKQCCESKSNMGDQYQVDGVTLSEAAAHPELILTRQRIREMRSYELYALEPKRLIPPLAEEVAIRLVYFREIPRAIEMLQAVGPDSLSVNALDEIAYEFSRARDVEALRWLVEFAPGVIFLSFDMEVLLASPSERMSLLQAKARDAIEADRFGDPSASAIFCDIGLAALFVDPALGLLIARGALPVSGGNQLVMIEDIEDARDLLGLDNNEPGYESIEATEQSYIDQTRHAADLEKARKETASRVSKRDAEIQQLKSQIEAMQETLTKREDAIQKAKQEKPAALTPAPSAQDISETRELRDQLRRLKDNLKVEHEEHNRAMRDLRSAQDQLRRSAREKNETSARQLPSTSEDEVSQSIAIDWESQSLRIPEYSNVFRDALRKHPRQVSAVAITAAGRLAAGDPSIWKTVRALKLRPGTLRVRIAGDYRLLFEIESPDTLRLTDLILRRDLERWLAAGGR